VRGETPQRATEREIPRHDVPVAVPGQETLDAAERGERDALHVPAVPAQHDRLGRGVAAHRGAAPGRESTMRADSLGRLDITFED
jgi:hypothetical protein